MRRVRDPGLLLSGEQLNYAFGLNIGEYRALKMVEHGGAWRGFRSHVVRFPDQKFAVIILSNLDTFRFRLTDEVIRDDL